MTAAYRFSLTIEEKGRAMGVTSAAWHSVALSCPVWGATWAPQWPVATKRHLQGMACSAPLESLELFPATAESLHNLFEDLTFAHVIQTDMMSILFIYYYYFSPYPILHSLCGATAKIWGEADALDCSGSSQSTRTDQDKGKGTKYHSFL